MKCELCGAEFEPIHKRGPNKYCSENCKKKARAEQARMRYVGKRQEVCEACGKPLPKYKTKWCSRNCMLNKRPKPKKICVICGQEFETFRENVLTCSKKCSKSLENQREREQYRKHNPGARSMDEIMENSQKRKETKQREAAERKNIREAKLQKAREKKAKEKQKRIDYWKNYCKLHECAECGEMFVAHYPLAKYCSKKCERAKYKTSDRYDGITVDKGITLKRLAKRDNNICALCGKPVDWNDFYIDENNTVICGDNYPSRDHIKPISKGGLHSWGNVQLAHRKCNTLKSNKEQVT